MAKWVNPTIAVPTPSYSAQMAAEALEESGAAEVSSSSDANPLAATPLLNKKRAKQGSGIPDAALLIPATLFAAAAGVLLVLRKRCMGAASGLKGSALAAERAKATKMSRLCYLSAVAAAAFTSSGSSSLGDKVTNYPVVRHLFGCLPCAREQCHLVDEIFYFFI